MSFALLAYVKAKFHALASCTLWIALTTLFGLVSAAFFVAAIYVWLRAEFDPLTACLILGAGFAMLTALTIIIMLIVNRRRRRLTSDPLSALTADLLQLDGQFSRTMKGPQGKYVLLAAIAAGWLFSRTMSKR